MKFRKTISFILDNEVVTIDPEQSGLRPTITLLKFLRSLPGHKGTKEGCGEGDCGACTVVLAEMTNSGIHYKAVDSCLIFLPQIHGKQVITVENLETHSGGHSALHHVQQSIIEEHATQCGFCTPGVAMSVFAMAKNYPDADEETIHQSLSGNLCRCTGYHSIQKAAHRASRGSVKDQFCKTKKRISGLLKEIIKNKTCIRICSENQEYYKPFNINDFFQVRTKFPDALIVSGSTDIALRVTKKHEIISKIIDISDISELRYRRKVTGGIEIGAGVKLEEIRLSCQNSIPSLFEMLSTFGSMQIRNMATLGGNVGSASPIGDTLPVLFAHKAEIVVCSKLQERRIPVERFITGYRATDLKTDEIIRGIFIPYLPKRVFIRSYKVSKRKDLDISTVSGAFRLKKDSSGKVTEIILAYGGMAAMTKRAVHTEKYLIDKPWSTKTIEKAKVFIEKDFSPISDARSGKDMRLIAARNMLLSFFHDSNTVSS